MMGMYATVVVSSLAGEEGNHSGAARRTAYEPFLYVGSCIRRPEWPRRGCSRLRAGGGGGYRAAAAGWATPATTWLHAFYGWREPPPV